LFPSRVGSESIERALAPYLEILRHQFAPERVILFGSYAYGTPTWDSDVDLLVVKSMDKSPWEEALAIRRAWRVIRLSDRHLPIELILETPEGHSQRLSEATGFYDEIVQRGHRLI